LACTCVAIVEAADRWIPTREDNQHCAALAVMVIIEELLCRMAAGIPKKDAIMFLYEEEFLLFDRVCGDWSICCRKVVSYGCPRPLFDGKGAQTPNEV
jgi:hypothetical protein